MTKLVLLLLSLSFSINAIAVDSYSIYLVRHAEKQKEGKNPKLTQCGQLRATQLASMLSQVNISQVYSTSYQRTMQTARPLAKSLQLAIKNYNPKYLSQLAVQLQKEKENTLVVGHSNTTPQLAKLLSDMELPPLTENDYQQLYQVQFIKGHKVVTRLTQPLLCHQEKKTH